MLIATNMIIEDVQAWLIIDIILIIILTNRVIENYRVGHNLNRTIRRDTYEVKKLQKLERANGSLLQTLNENITFRKISYFFSALFAGCLALLSINMVIGDIQAWFIIDIILLISFGISIIVRTAILGRFE